MQYSHLLVIGIDDDEFYDARNVELGYLPPIEVQQELLSEAQAHWASQLTHNPLEARFREWSEAEKGILYQLEKELLALIPQEEQVRQQRSQFFDW
jgi:hypothetical protein